MEPISPELVLVDPELARFARAKLASSSELAAIRRAVEAATLVPPLPPASRFTLLGEIRERLTLVVLSLSVAFNGALVAILVHGDGASRVSIAGQRAAALQHTGPVHEVAATAVERVSTQPRTTLRPRKAAHAARNVPSRRTVERRILTLAFRSPKTTLPPQLIDPSTGLPKNNLQVICSHERARIFRCLLRSAMNHRLRVHYRVRITRRGLFSWSRPGPALARR